MLSDTYLVQAVENVGGEVHRVQWLDRPGAPDRLLIFKDGLKVWAWWEHPGEELAAQEAREPEREWFKERGWCAVPIDEDRWSVDALLFAIDLHGVPCCLEREHA